MSHLFLLFRLRNELSASLFRWTLRRKFKQYGRGSRIVAPIGIEGIENIVIGDDVYIAHQVVLAAVPLTGEKTCLLKIDDGARIGRNNHIYATGQILIGKQVVTANNVYIADNSHSYEAISCPIIEQPVLQKSFVEIGDGCWLGNNVCVIGARIGRNCVIGANAVVTMDVPDYSVVVGAPARVVKRYNETTSQWERTDAHGEFL